MELTISEQFKTNLDSSGKDRYTLNEKPLTGVTTILNVIAKPALIQWSANMAIEYVRKNLKNIEDLEDVLKIARTAHAQKRDKSADIGTEVHKAVEEWIKDGKEPELDAKGMTMFTNFKNWALDNNVKFLGSELSVYSEKHWYAGTFDFICEIDGKKFIGDLKTSNGIYGREYFLQMAGYRIALEELGFAKDIEGAIVVRCGKDGSFETKYSFDYESDKKGFLSALELYRVLQTWK